MDISGSVLGLTLPCLLTKDLTTAYILFSLAIRKHSQQYANTVNDTYRPS